MDETIARVGATGNFSVRTWNSSRAATHDNAVPSACAVATRTDAPKRKSEMPLTNINTPNATEVHPATRNALAFRTKRFSGSLASVEALARSCADKNASPKRAVPTERNIAAINIDSVWGIFIWKDHMINLARVSITYEFRIETHRSLFRRTRFDRYVKSKKVKKARLIDSTQFLYPDCRVVRICCENCCATSSGIHLATVSDSVAIAAHPASHVAVSVIGLSEAIGVPSRWM